MVKRIVINTIITSVWEQTVARQKRNKPKSMYEVAGMRNNAMIMLQTTLVAFNSLYVLTLIEDIKTSVRIRKDGRLVSKGNAKQVLGMPTVTDV